MKLVRTLDNSDLAPDMGIYDGRRTTQPRRLDPDSDLWPRILDEDREVWVWPATPTPWTWPDEALASFQGGGTLHKVSYEKAEKLAKGLPIQLTVDRRVDTVVYVDFVEEVKDLGPHFGPDVSAMEVCRRHGFPASDEQVAP